jgi:hypothetical protein
MTCTLLGSGASGSLPAGVSFSPGLTEQQVRINKKTEYMKHLMS